MTTFETNAICLRTTPFREADLIVTFFSAEHGILRAIAKGIKKSTSKMAGACEPLTLNHLQLASGRNLHTLCHYDRLESFPHLRLDLEKLAVGSICVEIVRLLGRENDPDSRDIYLRLAEALHQLDQQQTPWISVSLHFHLAMLEQAGYLPPLAQCVHCETGLPLDELPYFPFALEAGGLLCRQCAGHFMHQHRVNVSSNTIRLLLSPTDNRFFGNAVRAHKFLNYYWGHRLETQLKSFDFLFQLLDQRHHHDDQALLATASIYEI